MVYTFSNTTFDDILRSKYWFNRDFKEKDGFIFEHLENGNGQLVANVLGIEPDDISVTVEASEYSNTRQSLKISGKTEALNQTFEVNYVFTIKPVETITYEVKNGLLVVELAWSKPVSPDVEIKRK